MQAELRLEDQASRRAGALGSGSDPVSTLLWQACQNPLLNECASRIGIPLLAGTQEAIEVGAESGAIPEAVSQVFDEFAAWHARLLGVHVVLERCNHRVDREYFRAAKRERPLEIKKVTAFAALEESPHLGREHLVQVKGDERR